MSVRLFVLGVLNQRETHGYQFKELARTWNLDKWADIGYGSIYHALATLEKEGLVQAAGIEQEGGRPPRSIYRITDEGRRVFLALLREACKTSTSPKHPINLALAFILGLPPEERVALLEERLRSLEARHELVEQTRAQLRPLEKTAPAAIATVEHDLGHSAFEIRWTRALIEKVALWGRPDTPSPT